VQPGQQIGCKSETHQRIEDFTNILIFPGNFTNSTWEMISLGIG
jgi:hypothetical protein